MNSELLIVFVKNPQLGKVKTRLAKTVGDQNALIVYQKLLDITQKATTSFAGDIHIYCSNFIQELHWTNAKYFVQEGEDLGERMLKAFEHGFDLGYEKIVLIGSDLPNISNQVIDEAFSFLSDSSAVFGPAEDGGYYLVGLNQMHNKIFQNKAWSTSTLLEETLKELDVNNIKLSLTKTLNDIDTFDDLKSYPELVKLIE